MSKRFYNWDELQALVKSGKLIKQTINEVTSYVDAKDKTNKGDE